MRNEFPKDGEEQMRILKEWAEYVRSMFGTNSEYRAAFKNPTRKFILEQRETMAEMGTECTPDEVSELIRLISDTLETDP